MPTMTGVTPTGIADSIPLTATRRCWHCDAVAHMTRVGNAHFSKFDDGDVHAQGSFTCDECGWLQFATRQVDSSQMGDAGRAALALQEDYVDGLLWWPQVGVSRAFEDVPEHISDAASEAHRCYSIQAYRAAAALARAVIEASAKDKGITKGTLYDKIEALEAQHHVRPHIKEAAHEVRHLGNDVAHGDFVDPVEAEEAEETLGLMGEVLQEVFQSPARIERAKQKRLARKAADAAES